MTEVDMNIAAERLRWAIGPAAEAAPDFRDIRTVLAELTAARATIAEQAAEIERLRAEVGYMDAENERCRQLNEELRAKLNAAALDAAPTRKDAR